MKDSTQTTPELDPAVQALQSHRQNMMAVLARATNEELTYRALRPVRGWVRTTGWTWDGNSLSVLIPRRYWWWPLESCRAVRFCTRDWTTGDSVS